MKKTGLIIILFLSFQINGQKEESVKIATWNIQDLGRSKKPKHIQEIAKIVNNFDIIAIQEVVAKDPRGAQAVGKIVNELNRMGSKWDYRVSDPTKSPSAQMSERYAFLWKTSKVKLLARPRLDTLLNKTCVREPYIGKFETTKTEKKFNLVNFHGRTHNKNPEQEIKYFIDYPTRFSPESIIILGDFNLSEHHAVWNNFYKNGFESAVKNRRTTLVRKCKARYLNHAIDNIYFEKSKLKVLNSGAVDFVRECKNLRKKRKISDHLPVYFEVIFE